MNRIEDERIRFWLEHEARIREWAGLEADVRQFADRFYRSLQDDLAEALGSGQIADDDVKPFFLEYPDGWRGLGLRRHDWPSGDDDPDVRLEWHRKRVCFSDGDHLICGVRTKPPSLAEGDAVARLERYRRPFTKKTCPHHPDQSDWWPAFTHVGPPVGRFWEGDNLKEHGDRLVETIVKAWKNLVPLVDEAVGRPTR